MFDRAIIPFKYYQTPRVQSSFLTPYVVFGSIWGQLYASIPQICLYLNTIPSTDFLQIGESLNPIFPQALDNKPPRLDMDLEKRSDTGHAGVYLA